MSTRDRRTSGAIGAGMILLLLALYGLRFFSPIFGWIPIEIISIFLIAFAFLGLIILYVYTFSSRLAEVDGPMDDSTTRPGYYEETKPKDVNLKTPTLSCPDCGHKNPGDADFCVKCGQDLDVTDDVARY